MPGSGKTTFQLRGLINTPCACRFVFDDRGEASGRLGLPHASTANELSASLQTPWSLYNPHRMFEGDIDGAFLFWCEWVFKACKLSPHKKIVMVDEVWRFQSPHGIPRELQYLTQTGRAENIHTLFGTQLPHKLHASITGTATEAVIFRLDERNALDRVQEFGIAPERVANLPLGTFIARNRLSGRELCHRVF